MAKAGRTHPIGADAAPGGVNFCVFSKGRAGVELLLFDRVDDPAPSRTLTLDPKRNRTYHYWHAFVPGLAPGQLYGYRVPGLEKLLLDPYGRAVAVPAGYSRKAAAGPGDNTAAAMKSVVVPRDGYNWEGDAPLRRPFAQTVIYELHVGGFTRHPSSGIPGELRGTYAGLVEKIPYLRNLGVTAVELLPVFQFDSQDAPRGLVNYWGYSPVSFFAPHAAYCSRGGLLSPIDEFRDMVKALHRAGIEVILDVVYNHTAEGGDGGPSFSFRGLAEDSYYILDPATGRHTNYSGCGNTLDPASPVVRRIIMDSLRYWVERMHVDGFRFDLASILSRDEKGRPLENPPLLWDIESDPVLAGTKLIAEAWDAAGLYQVGTFVGDSWKEWNGRFRDDVRSFLKGDSGSVSRFASRLLGSPDIYGYENREPEQSINFVTCHDGFTLNDLVSYNGKHNDANGENNRDGSDDNRSWNCGAEGPSDDPAVESLRSRQAKNLLAVTLLAIGTPMVSMGDEVRRTQGGNNNGYCQDNEISWFDWRLPDRHADLHRFVRLLLDARLRRDMAVEDSGLTLNQILGKARLEWHGVMPGQPDWGSDSHSIALTAWSLSGRLASHILVNAWREPLSFGLPPVAQWPGSRWRRWIDTSLPSPDDIVPPAEAPPVEGDEYPLPPYSLAVLLARPDDREPSRRDTGGKNPPDRTTLDPSPARKDGRR